MQTKLHKNARTTPAIRREIQQSPLSAHALSKKYNISWSTAKRWKETETLEDRSSRPHRLRTDLKQAQIERILFERKQFKKTIEEIFFTLEDEIPNLYPMKIYRVLARYDLGRLPEEFLDADRKIKKFRNYGIGYLHIDLLYAPKINGQRSYIYTAIDRVSKIAFVLLGANKRKETGAKFLRAVLDFYPYKINYILTDNVLTPKSTLPGETNNPLRLVSRDEAFPCSPWTVPLWSSTCDVIPSYHSDTGSAAWRPLLYFKQTGFPVEGPSIIYEVLTASTARLRGIDPLGTAASKYVRYGVCVLTTA